MADWNAIKSEYITSGISYRALADKYGLNRNTIAERGKAEKWPELRRQHLDKTLSKTLSLIEKKQAQKMVRIDRITDRMLLKLEKAVEELEVHLVTHTTKVKEIEYNNDQRPDKPTKEVIREEEKLEQVVSVVDRLGLKQIASALRDIKEVQMLRSELDRQEQEARIANLRKQAQSEENQSNEVTVVIEGGDPAWQS